MSAAFILFWAKQYSRESIYSEREIIWVMDVLYKHYKKQDETKKHTKSMLIICANYDVSTLYKLYKTFCDGGIIRPLDLKRKTFEPLNYHLYK